MASHVSLLVTGSRHAEDRVPLWSALDAALEAYSYDSLSLFVGCARGADQLARDWWHERQRGHVLTSPEPMVELFTSAPAQDPCGLDDGFRERLYVFRADWAGHGKGAGPRRNERLVEAWTEDGGAHHAFAMWTGDVKGSGTLDCMSRIVRTGHCFEVIPA
jgi:hypothetical protein